MDFSFHVQQGQQLLEKRDAASFKKALEHFKKANEMTEEGHIGKPKILYHLHKFRKGHKRTLALEGGERN